MIHYKPFVGATALLALFTTSAPRVNAKTRNILNNDGDYDLLGQTFILAHNGYALRDTEMHVTSDGSESEVEVYLPMFMYRYPHLSELLANGVCGLELDVANDDDGDGDDVVTYTVRHIQVYDDKATCSDLQECLNEIADYLQNNQVQCPIMIKIEIKPSVNTYSADDLRAMDNMIRATFSSRLFTPKDLGASAKDQHWPSWLKSNGKSKMQPGNVFVTVKPEVIEQIYPDANEVADNNTARYYEKSSIFFARCDSITDHRYCVYATTPTNNQDEKSKYLFETSVGAGAAKQILPSDATVVDLGDANYVVRLPNAVQSDMKAILTSDTQPLFGEVMAFFDFPPTSEFVPYSWWNAWSLIAFTDARGNGDGIWDTVEAANFVFYATALNEDLRDGVQNLMELPLEQLIQELAGLFPDLAGLTLDGLQVNNPLLWLIVSNILTQPPLDEIATSVADPMVLKAELCTAMQNGQQYISTDYPYQLSTNADGEEWIFTVASVREEC